MERLYENQSSPSDQFDFWSQNPCGATGALIDKMKQRYRLEPWIPIEIKSFPTKSTKYLEVGAGQGIDAFNICRRLDSDCEYTGIDYSEESVNVCNHSIEEAKELFSLPIIPEFRQATALDLPFEGDTFDFVYSLGVIHHTPDAQKGIDEVHRVLKKGGSCAIVLYRRNSLKVGVAKFLRYVQSIIDKLTGKELTLYNLFKGNHFSDTLGTMLLECFGVPWMYWYSESELRNMFSKFRIDSIEPYGFNFLRIRKIESGKNRFGYFYRINATKI